MALMGRAMHARQPKTLSISQQAPKVNLNWAAAKEAKEMKEKDRFSYLKDAYVFAKNNKDYLDDPEVIEILQQKIEKAGFDPMYTRKGASESMNVEAPTFGGGTTEGAIQGPGAGSQGQLTEDWPATVEGLYNRFMMEYPQHFGPTEYEQYSPQEGFFQKRKDFISGQEENIPTAKVVKEGDVIKYGGKEEKIKKTTTPQAFKDSDMVMGWKHYNRTHEEQLPIEVYKRELWDKPSSTGELTEKQKVDILYQVKMDALKGAKAGELTQEIVDTLNEQLERIGSKDKIKWLDDQSKWYLPQTWFDDDQSVVFEKRESDLDSIMRGE